MIFLLIILSSFIESGGTSIECNHKKITVSLFLATQVFTIQPGDTTIALYQMSNATFHCTCTDCQARNPPHWTVENQDRHLATNDDADKVILAQRGITYGSSSTSAVISIYNNIEAICILK